MNTQEQFDSFEKASRKLAEHDQKLSNQYDATDAFLKRLAALQRKVSELEKRNVA